MADMWVEKPYLKINDVDYSSKVRSVKVTFGREPIERTAGGDATRTSMPGLKNWRIEATLKEDYAGSGLDEALFALADAGTTFAVEVRPGGAATFPKYAANKAMIDGPYDLLSGSVGSLAEKTIAFVPAGAVPADSLLVRTAS